MSTLTSKDEYLKASRALATGFGPTTDFADGQIGATAQSEAGIPASASELPGQVFTVDQLPDPAVAVAYGLPPQTVPEHLILDNVEDGMKHVQGKSALDLINGQLREELGNPVIAFDGTVRSADDSLLHLSAKTGAGVSDPDADRAAVSRRRTRAPPRAPPRRQLRIRPLPRPRRLRRRTLPTRRLLRRPRPRAASTSSRARLRRSTALVRHTLS
jgi:hypothetical protein